MFHFMNVFTLVRILSSLFSMASDNDVYLHKRGGADPYMVSGSLIMASVMASNYTMYVCIHFSTPFPLITFVVNMMYLQMMYQHEALQMPKMIKEKGASIGL